MKITTTFEIPGYTIDHLIDVITANQVIGNNIISENIASLTDIFGGTSGQYRNKLDELVVDVQEQLKYKAMHLGANAIIGYSVSTNQISSKGMSMFMITASGTAVHVSIDKHEYLKRLQELNSFLNDGLISQEEFEKEKGKCLDLINHVEEEEKNIEKIIEKESEGLLEEGQLVIIKANEKQFRIDSIVEDNNIRHYYSKKFDQYFTRKEIEDFDEYWIEKKGSAYKR